MKTVKTSELSGRALDYAVALAIGAEFEMTKYGICIVSGDGFFPSFYWRICGELLEHYMIDVSFCDDEEHEPWSATSPLLMGEYFTGDNAKIAICRAVVGMSKLGGTVEIPEELLK